MTSHTRQHSAQPLLDDILLKPAEDIPLEKDTGHLPTVASFRPGIEQMYTEESQADPNDSFKVGGRCCLALSLMGCPCACLSWDKKAYNAACQVQGYLIWPKKHMHLVNQQVAPAAQTEGGQACFAAGRDPCASPSVTRNEQGPGFSEHSFGGQLTPACYLV